MVKILVLLIYQAYGMAALPVGLIKGYRNVRMEKMDIVGRKNETRARVDAIRNKVGDTQHTCRAR